jgi:hypothetical protein
MSRPVRRRRSFTEARSEHRQASTHLAAIDTELEALLARRRRCLADLADTRAQLCRRWGTRNIRRDPMVDEAPLPPPVVDAEPLWGTDLRAVCLRLLRRHGPQRLRDLHGLLHCYGFVVDSVRPVQRLADALAYECAHGRAQRVRRGVYEAVGDGRLPFPAPLAPEPDDLLPWRQPETDPGPPFIDHAVALDPEHWSADAWPDAPDPDGPGPNSAEVGTPDPDSADAGTLSPKHLRGDSSTNRPSGPAADGGGGRGADGRAGPGRDGGDEPLEGPPPD